MTSYRIFIASGLLSLFCSAFAAPSKATFPMGTEVEWNKLIQQNKSPMAKQFIRSSKVIHDRLMYKGIPYATQGISERWEYGYQTSPDKFIFMRKYGVDCTRLLRYLFLNMIHLPYNSQFPEEPIISHTFANVNKTNQKQLKNFIRIPHLRNGFHPQTGDILAFPGHAIAVLDPKNCISIQSSNWVCKKVENGLCLEAEKGKSAGVAIYKLASNRFCSNGNWKGMDNENLNFTEGWRHRAFTTWITDMPKNAHQNQKIILIGKNIAGKYIYFPGSKKPVRTKQIKQKHKNPALQSVSLIVPKDAKSGKLKIYWGIGKASRDKTIESRTEISIQSSHTLKYKS